jgi:hypothetical protein
LSLAHEHDVDLEGMSLFYIIYLDCCFGGSELILGACERSIACSTCHVILDPEIYDKLPEPEDEENDMLDLAFALEDTYVLTLFHSSSLLADLCLQLYLWLVSERTTLHHCQCV